MLYKYLGSPIKSSILQVGFAAVTEAEVYISILSCGEKDISTYCRSLVLKLEAVGWYCKLIYGDNTLPVIALVTTLILSLLNSSNVLVFKSPPYSFTTRALLVIPKVDTNVCNP